MINYMIEIVSVNDRENLVAEIWIDNELLAEIDNETDILNVQIYPIKAFSLNYYDFIKILNEAKDKLLQ